MAKDKKITLIDAETNISYEIIVNEEDAEKVSREDNEDANNLGSSQLNKNQNSSKNSECGSGSYNWNRAETLLLITIYKEMENDFTSEKMTQKQCWNKVAQMMQAKGVNINAQKCCTKYQTLKQTYCMINDHNRKFGNSRKT